MKSACYYWFVFSVFIVGCKSSKYGGVAYTSKVELLDSGAKIKCFVYDKLSSTPLDGAAVRIENTKRLGFAENDGSVEFDVEPGKYKLVIQDGHFSGSTKNINVKSGQRIVIKSYFNLPHIE